jgi:hypothetical protein
MDHKRKLLAKAATDPKFLADLKKDPAAVIARETGVSVPAGITVKVVEDTDSVVHLVVPKLRAVPKGELGENELSQVSGGVGGSTQHWYDRCNNSTPGSMQRECAF